MNARTTLVTLTYGDRAAYLRTLIERSLQSPFIDRVIVVSNAATADLPSLARQWPGQVEVVPLAENTGSAHGYRVGIEAALNAGAEHIWLMDDDNAPTSGSIERLHQCLAERQAQLGLENAAVIGFRPGHQADFAAGVPRAFAVQWRSSCFGFHILQLPYKIWRRLPFGRPQPKAVPAPQVRLPFTTYGGLLAHASLYRKIGLPRSEMVLYADDTEYTWRITAQGGQITLVTGALLDDQEESWNTKARTRNIYETFLLGGSDLRAYYTARNQAWFDKHVWAGQRWLYRLNRGLFLFLLRQVARRQGTGPRLQLIEQAMRDGEAGRLGVHKAFAL